MNTKGYYRIDIDHTSETDESNETFDTTTVRCADKAAVVKYLADNYKGITPSLVVDECLTTGKREHVGLAYAFDNSDVSHVPVVSWRQIDWVGVVLVCEEVVSPDELGVTYQPE